MTRHRTLHHFAATAVLGLVLLSACSSTSRSADTSTTTAPSSTSSTTAVATTLGSNTTLAPSTSAATTTAPVPTTTTPPAPPPTIAPNIAPPPAACVAPSADSEPVELVITDNGVLFDGAPAPSCMRVPESFRFRFTNNAEGDATVAFGDGNGTVAAGDSELTDPLGEIFFVGDKFQVAIIELSTVIDVEVIAIP